MEEKSLLTYISPDLPRLFSLLYCFFIILQTRLHEEARQRKSQENQNPKTNATEKLLHPAEGISSG